MVKRALIRGLWGLHENDEEFLPEMEKFKYAKHLVQHRRMSSSMERIFSCIQHEQSLKYKIPTVTYVLGKRYNETLKKMGLETVLICNDPFIYHAGLCHQGYWHKFDVLKYAMEVDGYDEVVFLDWDCYPIRQFSADMWNDLNKKESFQACLQFYKRQKIEHRKQLETDFTNSNGFLPNAGFIYLRDKSFIDEMKEYRWVPPASWSEESAMAKWLDAKTGGWVGVEKYYELFEPSCCNLHKRGTFRSRKIKLSKEKKINLYLLHNLKLHRNKSTISTIYKETMDKYNHGK